MPSTPATITAAATLNLKRCRQNGERLAADIRHGNGTGRARESEPARQGVYEQGAWPHRDRVCARAARLQGEHALDLREELVGNR